ncbi:ABC transporter substrate-binding protein [Nakamurella sp. YIM 132087]|uniref:ABC transporter substrate-binding protein n=1 Tax=Nakamurella alba TaxID=2665158 RepID=A0A7K1FT34_9ACTN|nr:iron-siderophore ABC transporter substrate-binding protein [Nakamurella alba]MTD17281.1 ABC transporter substrate-binding protein [Nakamurella alba]
MHRLTRTFAAAVAAVATLGLAACSSGSDAGTSSTAATTAATSAASSATSAAPSSDSATSAAGSSTSASSAASGPVTVTDQFGTVTVPELPADAKVVALGWSDAEMALALGVVPVAVYDWQGFGEANKGVGPWATSLFGDVTPEIITRGDQTLNYEQILALSPDLILNTRSSGDEAEYERLSEIAPTVGAPAGTAAFATAWDDQMTQVATALGKASEGETIVADVKQQIADVAAENPDFEGKTIVSASKFGDAYGAYLAGDGRFDLLADLGFVQNPAVLDLEASGFYAAVSAEQVTAFDADVAVVVPIGFTLAETEADPLLQSLTVTKDGREIIVDPAGELSGAYSAASVLSIPVVLEQLTPQLVTAVGKL